MVKIQSNNMSVTPPNAPVRKETSTSTSQLVALSEHTIINDKHFKSQYDKTIYVLSYLIEKKLFGKEIVMNRTFKQPEKLEMLKSTLYEEQTNIESLIAYAKKNSGNQGINSYKKQIKKIHQLFLIAIFELVGKYSPEFSSSRMGTSKRPRCSFFPTDESGKPLPEAELERSSAKHDPKNYFPPEKEIYPHQFVITASKGTNHFVYHMVPADSKTRKKLFKTTHLVINNLNMRAIDDI
ncbi:MAG: hypothetical protein H7A37_05455 [Chlamydiales bacterium]|nr:hypothetical protein [Chlamydiales bacterium]